MALGILVYIGVTVLLGVAYYYLAPTPSPPPAPHVNRPEDATAAGADQFKFPTAEEGKSIPVLFGTRRCSSPNIVWWGALRVEEILEWYEVMDT
jgi:hypothetical protein